jgi:N-methylhydantoinase B
MNSATAPSVPLVSTADPQRRADPVVTEIVRNGVIAVTEEMKTNLMRTAYNHIIYEALDFTTGLFNARGETVSIGLGLPMFIRGMAETLKAKIAHFGLKDIEPGDILVTNDGYITGSHLNHVTLSLPIFHEDKLVAFSVCMAHWLTIGGTIGGMTTDIYSEGLQIPILKLQRAGELNQDLIEIIKMNVHLPDQAMGDLRAQLTAVNTGGRRFTELLDRYGQDEVLASIDAIMEKSEKAARERTLSIPDGTYEAESFMDDDGVDIGKHLPIRVKVIVAGDRMTVDLSDVSAQVRGFYNSGPTTGYGASQVAYKCLTSPTDYPINDGSFRSLDVINPPGRVVSAVRPAPMRSWMTIPMTVVDTIFKALAPAVPDRVIAGHFADLGNATMFGFVPDEGRMIITSTGPIGGGWGAKMTEDGINATVCINDGDTHNSPVELMESKYPIVYDKFGLVEDSGGAGRHRGGLGSQSVVRMRKPLNLSTRIERMHCRPWGLDGAGDGLGNRVELDLTGVKNPEMANAKVFTAQLKAGDAFRVSAGGGGGFGPPWLRPMEKVREDVRQGYVSLESARLDYGVVLDPETLEADKDATAKLRAEMEAAA